VIASRTFPRHAALLGADSARIRRRRHEGHLVLLGDDGDDQMDENDEDVVHFGIVAKSQKAPEFRADLYLATDTPPVTHRFPRRG
jgi:hypothetical protein